MRTWTNLLLTGLTLLAAGAAGTYAADNDEIIKNVRQPFVMWAGSPYEHLMIPVPAE